MPIYCTTVQAAWVRRCYPHISLHYWQTGRAGMTQTTAWFSLWCHHKRMVLHHGQGVFLAGIQPCSDFHWRRQDDVCCSLSSKEDFRVKHTEKGHDTLSLVLISPSCNTCLTFHRNAQDAANCLHSITSCNVICMQLLHHIWMVTMTTNTPTASF